MARRSPVSKIVPKKWLVILYKDRNNSYHKTIVIGDDGETRFTPGPAVVGQWQVQAGTAAAAKMEVMAHLAGGMTNWPVVPVPLVRNP